VFKLLLEKILIKNLTFFWWFGSFKTMKILKGWELSHEKVTDISGERTNFYLNKGDQAASLEFAIETGTDSSCDEDIDTKVILMAAKEADKIDPEGEWVEYYNHVNGLIV
jgi:hypothetical protein